MKKCISCGADLQDNAQFCSECGTKQVARKQFCPECGSEVVAGSKFCMQCGTPLNVPPMPKVEAQPQVQAATKVPDTPPTTIDQPDENTLAISYKGVPFELKLVFGRDYGTDSEIPDFYIGKTPVTQILWFALMNNNPSSNGSNPYFPVTNVTPSLVTSFLVKLQKEFGVKLELPTKEQWEYAYAGGHKSKGYKFSGSNDLNEVGWTDRDLHPVGELFENELGLVDMEGHIEELQKGGDKSVYDTDNGKALNDEDFTGFRVVVNIPKDGFPASSPIAEMVNSLKPTIDKHHSEDAKKVKKMEEEKAARKKAEEEEAKRKAEEEEKKNSDPAKWKIKKDKEKKKYGLVDKAGKWRIEPIFDELGDDEEDHPFDGCDYCRAKYNDKWGYINFKGEWIVECKFDYVGCYFYDGIAVVEFKGKWGFIDKKGKFIIEPKFDKLKGGARDFKKGGLVAAKSSDKWGYINKKGEWVARPRFDDVKTWNYDLKFAPAAIGDEWGPVDIKGNWKPAEDQPQFILDTFL